VARQRLLDFGVTVRQDGVDLFTTASAFAADPDRYGQYFFVVGGLESLVQKRVQLAVFGAAGLGLRPFDGCHVIHYTAVVQVYQQMKVTAGGVVKDGESYNAVPVRDTHAGVGG